MDRSAALSVPGEGTGGRRDDRPQALLDSGEELSGIGRWVWTPAEGLLVWSDNLFRIYGLEPGDITPCVAWVFDRIHPEDRDRVVAEVEAMRVTGRMRPLDYRFIRDDGTVRHLQAVLVVAERRGQETQTLFGWVRDLTRQRRTERQVAVQLAALEALAGWDELEPGAEHFMAALGGAMSCVTGVLWLPLDDALVARVQWASGAVRLPALCAATASARLRRGAGLPGRAWEAGEPVQLECSAGFAHPREQAAVADGLAGAVALPAMRGHEALAVVELLAADRLDLSDRLMRCLTAVGHQLGEFLSHRRGELRPPLLTPRELEVLQLASRGLSARGIASALVVSPGTVRTHFDHVYEKLGVGDRAGAVAESLRLGLIR